MQYQNQTETTSLENPCTLEQPTAPYKEVITASAIIATIWAITVLVRLIRGPERPLSVLAPCFIIAFLPLLLVLFLATLLMN